MTFPVFLQHVSFHAHPTPVLSPQPPDLVFCLVVCPLTDPSPSKRLFLFTDHRSCVQSADDSYSDLLCDLQTVVDCPDLFGRQNATVHEPEMKSSLNLFC